MGTDRVVGGDDIGGQAFELDDETWARWDAEAGRRGQTLATFVRESVEAAIAKQRRRKRWDGSERRREKRTVLDATGTKAQEHRPA